ncbi:hypothetical protein Y886_13665 [Xanthomonas hyacinthi DSM 19077]|nr:hypothetical protein Y886_13665 [Xanthomonas hyacinthi DSM 19077]
MSWPVVLVAHAFQGSVEGVLTDALLESLRCASRGLWAGRITPRKEVAHDLDGLDRQGHDVMLQVFSAALACRTVRSESAIIKLPSHET